MKRSLLLFAVLLVALFASIGVSWAQAPRVINFQANLIDNATQTAVNGNVTVVFELFDDLNAGNQLWIETQNLKADNGYINAYLGADATRPFPTYLKFNQPLWLQITVDGKPYSRTPLTSTPYSMFAADADTAQYAFLAATVEDAAITQAKLAPGVQAIPWGNAGGDLQGTYPNPTIDMTKLKANFKGQITQDMFSEDLQLIPGGPAGGDLTGTYPNPQLGSQVVKTWNIRDGHVTTEKLNDAAVTTIKIADLAVTTEKIANDAVTSAKIATDAVGDDEIAASGVVAGTYGDARTVPAFTVNEDGRITNVNPTPIEVITAMPLIGDGTTANPITVSEDPSFVVADNVMMYNGTDWVTGKVTTANISSGTAANGDYLTADGAGNATWTPFLPFDKAYDNTNTAFNLTKNTTGSTMVLANNGAGVDTDPSWANDATTGYPTLIVRNDAHTTPGASEAVAIRTYGDVEINSALRATTVQAYNEVLVGVAPLQVSITPPTAVGAPLVIDDSVKIEGSLEVTNNLYVGGVMSINDATFNNITVNGIATIDTLRSNTAEIVDLNVTGNTSLGTTTAPTNVQIFNDGSTPALTVTSTTVNPAVAGVLVEGNFQVNDAAATFVNTPITVTNDGNAGSFTNTAAADITPALSATGVTALEANGNVIINGNVSGVNNLLTNDLTAGYIIVGDAANIAQKIPMTGDVTIDAIGTTTVADDSHNHTDATVADALTIDGGTINNTPIGGLVAAAGTFTDLTVTGNGTFGSSTSATSVTMSNDGSLPVLSLTGDLDQIGNATIVGDFNLTGNSTVVGDVNLTGNIGMTGNIDMTGSQTINNGRITVVNSTDPINDPLLSLTNNNAAFTDYIMVANNTTAQGSAAWFNNNDVTNPDATVVIQNANTAVDALKVFGNASYTGTVVAGAIENTPIGMTTPAQAKFIDIEVQGNGTFGTPATATTVQIMSNDLVMPALVVDGLTELNGNTSINGTVTVNGAYTLPTVDGTVGQVLATDGAGVTSWINNYEPIDATLIRNAGILGVNLANPNSWTGDQSFVNTTLTGAQTINDGRIVATKNIGPGNVPMVSLTNNFAGLTDYMFVANNTQTTGSTAWFANTNIASTDATVVIENMNPAGTALVINGNVAGTNNLMTTTLPDANIWVGNAGTASPVAMTGDVSITNAGLTAVADDSHNHTAATLPATTTFLGSDIDLATEVSGTLPDANLTAGLASIGGLDYTNNANDLMVVRVKADNTGYELANGSVLTNTTLTGNGTLGNELGLNLATSNTWTSRQNITVSDVGNYALGITNADNGGGLDIQANGTAGLGLNVNIGALNTTGVGISLRNNSTVNWNNNLSTEHLGKGRAGYFEQRDGDNIAATQKGMGTTSLSSVAAVSNSIGTDDQGGLQPLELGAAIYAANNAVDSRATAIFAESGRTVLSAAATGGYNPPVATADLSTNNESIIEYNNGVIDITDFPLNGKSGQILYIVSTGGTLAGGVPANNFVGNLPTMNQNRVYTFICINGLWYSQD